MAEGITVRTMRRSDVADVARLQREFERFLSNVRSGRSRRYLSQRTAARLLADAFGRARTFRALVATKDRRLIGYLFYHTGYDPDEMLGPVVHVIDLYVTTAQRGTGAGFLLMKEAASICRKLRGVALYFGVWRRDTLAVKFYRRLGASWVREVPFMRWPKALWPA